METDKLIDALGMIDDALIQDAENAGHKGRRPIARRIAVVAAAAVLCIALAIPALAAAGVGPVCDALYAISPAVAQRLKPVNLSCEDNGIRMEVVSANARDGGADIYIAMRDLTGDRIDGTIDLFDSYSIHRPFDSYAGCELVSYDPDQKAATFLIRITHSDSDQLDAEEITGDKITFSVGEFLSHKRTFEDALPALDLLAAPLSPQTREYVSIRGGGGPLYAAEDGPGFLAPQPETEFTPAPGVQITALGYIDGKLHIQAHYDDILTYDNHGFLWLADERGESLECAYSVSFWDEPRTGSFEEYVFDASPDALEEYKLWGYFVTCGTRTAGSWQVTFPLT